MEIPPNPQPGLIQRRASSRRSSNSRTTLLPQEEEMFRIVAVRKGTRLSQPFVLVASSLAILFVGVLDVLTGPEISLAFFYLLPVAFVAWFTGRWNGILYAVVSVLIERIASALGGEVIGLSVTSYWNSTILLLIFLVVVYLLTEFKNRLEREEILSRTDPLTEVANSRYFYTLAEMEIERLSRYEHPFTVAYMDVDNFKGINDRFGRRIGDELLCVVATTMQNNLRITDTVARLGGDEFVILLPETKGEGALTIFFRLRQLMMSAMQARGWDVTFSVGAITFVSPPMSVDSMIKAVDHLMYTVKNSGKDRIQHEVYE
jgi:diguanylate cyclase (GGDEF)-like protein